MIVTNMYSLSISGMSHRPLKRPFIVSRWRQFWFAPVTSFLGNVLMYFLFLLLFAYVLLVDFKPPPPSGPAISEYVLYFWVFTIVCEEIREVGEFRPFSSLTKAKTQVQKSSEVNPFFCLSKTFFVGMMTWPQSFRFYIQDVWNKCDLTAITLFIIGLACR